MAEVASEATEPTWLIERRRKGAALASELELPHQKSKGWEFTDLRELEIDRFEPAEANGAAAGGFSALLVTPEGSNSLVQFDSSAGDGAEPAAGEAPTEPVAMPLSVAASAYPELIAKHLGSLVPSDDPFVARNEAGWSGGAFVYVPAGMRFEQPVSLNAIQSASGSALHWRSLIVLEEGAEAEVWEQYGSTGNDVDALFNGVVELVIGQAATLRYVCGQALSESSWAFATQRARVERDGSLEWLALGFGSAHGKVRMETNLAGRGSSAKVTGAYAGHGRQHLDFDTTQEHAAPDTVSDLAFRGVLAGRSTAVWRGMIKVDKDAQRTDAFQESRNLLLSSKAHADAIPGLEIEADDVRCTHAAAIAKIDPDQLFYLRSRGLGDDDASRLVVDGFLAALIERTQEGPIREALADALEQRLELLLA